MALCDALEPRLKERAAIQSLINKDWGVSFLLFSTGNVIQTGAKSMEQAEDAMEKFKLLLKELS